MKPPRHAAPRKYINPNRARDHLANERTYLSWIRTAIALLGFGALIVRLRVLQLPLVPQPSENGWKLGLAFSLAGLLCILVSTQHYFTTQRNIDNDTYQPAVRWVLLLSAALFLLSIGVIYYVFNVPTAPPDQAHVQ